ncbi:MAG: PQQ-like beta-propeller repeat protein [Kiritimatiellia bacterium]|jgi:outer membrane protein assembly factor BamB|nr:PQQ-like beta-propeller repeat protein [Kiritimatiellia bacterium]MDP6776256.1 PQQ-like beta-propeller repeat protein [Candidatus Latescibacterota bacterium]
MKTWIKWVVGIFGVLLVAVLIFSILYWSRLSILMGTEELSGKTEAIPRPVSRLTSPLTVGDADWISWHGARGDRRSGVTGIIKDWSGGLEKLWEVDFLCQGNTSAAWSAPVVRGNRMIVCGRSTDSDLIFCFDPADGMLLWQASYSAKAGSSHGTGPRATPAIDDDRVYTFGRGGDLVCWKLFDGEEVWRANVSDEGGEAPMWGHASSPLILGERVIVQGGGTARTIAYDKLTGNVAWKSGQGLAGYAALTGMDLDGKPAVLVFHGKGFAALDARDGDELWNISWETPYDVNATTPMAIGDRVFITSGYGTGCVLLKAGRLGAEVLWQSEIIAAQHTDSYAIDGFLYGYSGDSSQNKGAFKCVGMEDGSERWTTNEMGWGTCVFVDGHLLCCDIKGNLFLMRPTPDRFVKISEMRGALGDVRGPVWTRPTVANGLLYLRFKQRLVCYRLVRGQPDVGG